MLEKLIDVFQNKKESRDEKAICEVVKMICKWVGQLTVVTN